MQVYSPETDLTLYTEAQIDTGADLTLLEGSLADELGLDLDRAPRIQLGGLAGTIEARIAEVELRLLSSPDLTIFLAVAFASNQGPRIGNLIGLDVLSHFDFALSHANRVGYLGLPETP